MLDIVLPLTSKYTKKNQKSVKRKFFRFNLKVSEDLDHIFLEKYKENPCLKYQHKWLTCYEPENHLNIFTDYFCKKYIIPQKNKISSFNIFGYSFKDNSILERINLYLENSNILKNIKNSKDLGLPVEGACLYSLLKFTTTSNIKKVASINGKADIFIVRHLMEHFWDINLSLMAIKELIIDDGIVVFEIPDSAKGLRSGLHSLLWEEYSHFLTEDSLIRILEHHNFKVQEYSHFLTEDSLIRILEHHNFKVLDCLSYPNQIADNLVVIAKKDKRIINKKKKSFRSKKILDNYILKFNMNKVKIKEEITNILKLGYKIYLFGAGHHASSFVSINNLDFQISGVIDDNIEKQEYNLSGSNIPIHPISYLNYDNDFVYILLTTNPEHNNKIINKINKINKKIQVKSIFDFYCVL